MSNIAQHINIFSDNCEVISIPVFSKGVKRTTQGPHQSFVCQRERSILVKIHPLNNNEERK